MIQRDEDALICDLAQYYHVLEYKKLPATMVASLAVGLKENSRSKLKMSGMQVSIETLLLAAIADRLSLLVWAQSKDATRGINRPKSLFDAFVSKNKEITSFDSGEDFEKMRLRIIQEIKERR